MAAITPGRASESFQTLSQGAYQTIFESGFTSGKNGSKLRHILISARTKGVLVRVTPNHLLQDGSYDTYLIDDGESVPFGSTSGNVGLISKVEVKENEAGAEVKWTDIG